MVQLCQVERHRRCVSLVLHCRSFRRRLPAVSPARLAAAHRECRASSQRQYCRRQHQGKGVTSVAPADPISCRQVSRVNVTICDLCFTASGNALVATDSLGQLYLYRMSPITDPGGPIQRLLYRDVAGILPRVRQGLLGSGHSDQAKQGRGGLRETRVRIGQHSHKI